MQGGVEFGSMRYVLAWIGAAAALVVFPYLALRQPPVRRRWVAAAMTLLGVEWLFGAYLVADNVAPGEPFHRSKAFASFALFGVLALLLLSRHLPAFLRRAGLFRRKPRRMAAPSVRQPAGTP